MPGEKVLRSHPHIATPQDPLRFALCEDDVVTRPTGPKVRVEVSAGADDQTADKMQLSRVNEDDPNDIAAPDRLEGFGELRAGRVAQSVRLPELEVIQCGLTVPPLDVLPRRPRKRSRRLDRAVLGLHVTDRLANAAS
jgi:hypothetical protein